MISRRIGTHMRSNVVGYVAVFLALGGTAMALPGRNTVDSGDIKNGQVKRPDVAANAIDGARVADGSIARGDLASGAAGPRAYARISGGSAPNTVDDALSRGITDANVVRQAAGLYCIYNLDFQPRHAQATLELNGSSFTASEVFVNTDEDDSLDCPNTPNGEEQVQVFLDSDGNPGTFVGVDSPIYLALWE